MELLTETEMEDVINVIGAVCELEFSQIFHEGFMTSVETDKMFSYFSANKTFPSCFLSLFQKTSHGTQPFTWK